MTESSTATSRSLTSGHQLARSTVWNLGASVASIAIALFSVPILIRYLGADRFGVITLAWVVEGQFSLFDLGLSRALTKLVAEKLGFSLDHEIPAIFWSAIFTLAAAGSVAGVLLRVLSPWLVHSVLKVAPAIQTETLNSFFLVAFSLPVVISGAGLRGYLEAHQRFDMVSAIRVPISLFSYVVPLLVLPFARTLEPLIIVLVSGRVISWVAHFVCCMKVSPNLRAGPTLKGAPLKHMFSFGGWMTVTNLVSPIMVNIDRFLIGSLISMAAVAYYATPYEAVTKLWIVPSAFSAVLFPAFATALARDKERAALLFGRAIKYIFVALFPFVVGVLALGHLGLRIWLGGAFAGKSSVVLSFLVVGVFANSLAQVPFWQIQAANRPDLAAKVHLVELPFYLAVFWGLTKRFGIDGAGMAWMLRTTVDMVVMFWFSSRLLGECKKYVRQLFLMMAGAVPVFMVAVLVRNQVVLGLAFSLLVTLGLAWFAWTKLLSPQERELVHNPLRFLRGGGAVAVAAEVASVAAVE